MSQELRNEAQRLKPSILNRHKNRCYVCGFDCRPVLIVHHIVPIHLGGDNDPRNIVALCPNCHAIVHKYMTYALQAEYEAESIGAFGPEGMPDELREIYNWTIELDTKQHDRLYGLAQMKPLEIEEDNYDWAF